MNINLNEISEKIHKISQEIMTKHANIIELELRLICNNYDIPPDKIILQCHPGDLYKISIVLSEFKITNKFVSDK